MRSFLRLPSKCALPCAGYILGLHSASQEGCQRQEPKHPLCHGRSPKSEGRDCVQKRQVYFGTISVECVLNQSGDLFGGGAEVFIGALEVFYAAGLEAPDSGSYLIYDIVIMCDKAECAFVTLEGDVQAR